MYTLKRSLLTTPPGRLFEPVLIGKVKRQLNQWYQLCLHQSWKSKERTHQKKSPGHGYLVDFSRELNGFQCRHIHTYIHLHMHVYVPTYLHTCIHTLTKKTSREPTYSPESRQFWVDDFLPFLQESLDPVDGCRTRVFHHRGKTPLKRIGESGN